MEGSPDEVKVLRWLREPHEGATTLWDSDLMVAFGWDLHYVQKLLTSLRDADLVEFRSVALSNRGASLGDLQLTRAGRRLVPPTEPSSWSSRLEKAFNL